MVPLTAVQLETLANLWKVAYLSRNSFQDPRFEVLFFHPNRGEDIRDYVLRRSVRSTTMAFVGDCEVDETHGPMNVHLGPTGALGYVYSITQFTPLYQSAYMVVERDALLDSCQVEYQGNITLRSSVSQREVADRFGDLTLYSPASDSLNAMWCSDDTVYVYEGWADFTLLPELRKETGAGLRIFGRDATVFPMALSRFDGLILGYGRVGGPGVKVYPS
jgi:hypothetical protein